MRIIPDNSSTSLKKINVKIILIKIFIKIWDIKYPLMTKNISPTNPPEKKDNSA